MWMQITHLLQKSSKNEWFVERKKKKTTIKEKRKFV
jgi:hypothetical protein